MPARRLPKQAFLLVAAATFIAGAVTVALEMILMRLATRYMGSASDGTTAALTAYLLGLLAGAALVLRLNNKKEGTAGLFTVAVLAGLAASGVVLALVSLSPAAAVAPLTFMGGLPFCAPLIFIPALLAGTIFPQLLLLSSRFFFGSQENYDAAGGENQNINNRAMLLYLVSNLGSALGALGAAVWLLPLLGIANSLYATTAGWLLVAFLISPYMVPEKRPEIGSTANSLSTPSADAAAPSPEEEAAEIVDIDGAVMATSQPFSYAAVFFAALAGLLFECISIRMLALICGSSFISTACAVAATLLAIALGTRIAIFLPAHKNTRLPLAMSLAFAAFGLALALILVPHLNNVFQALRQLGAGEFSQAERHGRWLAYMYPRLMLSLIFCLPGATGLSMIFPAAAKSASRPLDLLRLYIAGGIGTALAPLVFVSGLEVTLTPFGSTMALMLRLTAIATVGLAVGALMDPLLRGKKLLDGIPSKIFCLTALAAAALALFFVRPPDVNKLDMGLSFVPARTPVTEVLKDQQASKRLFYMEGRTATISVLAKEDDNTISLRSDGKVEGTVPANIAAPAPGSDLSTQSLLALLPIVWHGAEVNDSLLIGYGTGTTAATMSRALPLGSQIIVEIEPDVIAAGPIFQQNWAAIKRPMLELAPAGSTAVTTDDARQFLQQSSRNFDIIISQPAEPWVQGSSNLYSAEFYSLVRNRLAKGGIYCQWLQLYGMDSHGLASAIKTLHGAFPRMLVLHFPGAGELLVLGFKESDGKNNSAGDEKNLRSNFLSPHLRPLMARAGVESVADLKQAVWLDGDKVGKAIERWQASTEAVVITDDNLALELDTIPEIESGARCIVENLALFNGLHEETLSENAKADGAATLLARGDEEAARKEAQAALHADPYLVRALNVLAAVALRQGQVVEAEKFALRSVTLYPDGETGHMLKSLAALAGNKPAVANAEADLAHRLNRLDYRPYVFSAAACRVAGEKEKATAMLSRARQNCSDSVQLKHIDDLAEEFSRPSLPVETSNYSGTLVSRLSRFLPVAFSSGYTRCKDVL